MLTVRFPSGRITFVQRRINVDVTSWRFVDIDATLHRRHDIASE